MGKVINIDGVPHRIRRGKAVPIPAEWLGKVTHDQTIRKRPSKSLHKYRKWMSSRGLFDYKSKGQEDQRAIAEQLEDYDGRRNSTSRE